MQRYDLMVVLTNFEQIIPLALFLKYAKSSYLSNWQDKMKRNVFWIL